METRLPRGAVFCPKITRDLGEYAAKQAAAEAGMAEKSAEFREKGGEVYVEVEGGEREEEAEAD